MVDWELETMYALRVVIAAFLGGMIGWEREWHGREAGIRTCASVALSSCVFALISSHILNADTSRLVANIVTGVGFLGAGIILRDRGRTVGLTTAASIWATAAVGTAVGFGTPPVSEIPQESHRRTRRVRQPGVIRHPPRCKGPCVDVGAPLQGWLHPCI